MVVKGKAKCQVVFDVEIPIDIDLPVVDDSSIHTSLEIKKVVHDNLKWWVRYCEENRNSGTVVSATENVDNEIYIDEDDELYKTKREYEEECTKLEEEALKRDSEE